MIWTVCWAAIERRHKAGKRFSILAVAEGAISKEDAQLSKKEYNKKIASSPYPSISYELGAKIEEAIGREVRLQFRDIRSAAAGRTRMTGLSLHDLVQRQAVWS